MRLSSSVSAYDGLSTGNPSHDLPDQINERFAPSQWQLSRSVNLSETQPSPTPLTIPFFFSLSFVVAEIGIGPDCPLLPSFSSDESDVYAMQFLFHKH
jgi:hypothetical protein